MRQKSNLSSKNFWNKEYGKGGIFNLSSEPAEDLKKFTRWLDREYGAGFLNNKSLVLDLGCGNGRNLIYLSREFLVSGIGYDISDEAVKQAVLASKDLPLKFIARSIAGEFPLPDNSADVIIDMMASHYLKEKERNIYLQEVSRILKPGGYLFFKSFLKEEDRHAVRLLREHGAGEENAYIHPVHGTYEYVWAEDNLRKFFEKDFDIEKLERSGKHLKDGKAFKRRSVVAYLRKKF